MKWFYGRVKGFAVWIYRCMCRLFPVKQNRVVFDSSLGKSYSGNPRHIFECAVKKGLDKKWDCIWFYESIPYYQIPDTAKQAHYGRLRYLYYMATAKVWVFDCRQPEFLVRRKGTYYIQTWHGTPLKKLCLDMEDVFMVGEKDIGTYQKHFVENVATWDYLIAQNHFASDTFRRAFDFKKNMLEIGYPRNDILFHENNPDSIEKRKIALGIPLDKKVLLYAPTWRDDEYSGAKYQFRPHLDFAKLQKELGDEYVMIVKYHYLIMDSVDWSAYKGFVYHFDQSHDIAELFIVSDMLITDYSSVMFDYSLLNRPMLFFAYDKKKYKNELRGFYFSYTEEMPGPISTTTEELIHDIRTYDGSLYVEKYKKFKEKYNSIDHGDASEKVVELVDKLIES